MFSLVTCMLSALYQKGIVKATVTCIIWEFKKKHGKEIEWQSEDLLLEFKSLDILFKTIWYEETTGIMSWQVVTFSSHAIF